MAEVEEDVVVAVAVVAVGAAVDAVKAALGNAVAVDEIAGV